MHAGLTPHGKGKTRISTVRTMRVTSGFPPSCLQGYRKPASSSEENSPEDTGTWPVSGFSCILATCSGKALLSHRCSTTRPTFPSPPLPKDVLGTDGGVFTVEKDGTELFSAETGQDGLTADALEDAIAEASMYVSQRIGDIVAVELAPASVLSGRDEKRTGAAIRFKDRELLRFCIVR